MTQCSIKFYKSSILNCFSSAYAIHYFTIFMSIFQATRGAHLEDGIVHLMMTRVFPDVSFDGSLVLAAVAADCTAKPSS